MRKDLEPRLAVTDLAGWRELQEFLVRLEQLPWHEPVQVAELFADLHQEFKGIGARVREDAMLAATSGPGSLTQRQLAEQLDIPQSRIGPRVAHARRRNGMEVRTRRRPAETAPDAGAGSEGER